ncbi:MAG: IgA Peptidase M64 [Thermoanaerobaculia bacterium]|nr:IgA Peptidase M64 [Thermoanaerobaculia bacterium]
MTRTLSLALLGLAFPLLAQTSSPVAPALYSEAFTPDTMRVDLFHTGGMGQEIFALDRVVNDGPWAGSTTRLVDSLDLGDYRFEVRDRTAGKTLYSRGYSSLCAEWATTSEPRTRHRTFHESLRFPWPKQDVEIRIFSRDKQNAWRLLHALEVSPESIEVNRARYRGPGTVIPILENGSPAQKVDLLILGDGYGAKETAKFRADARRLVDLLFTQEPFKSRKTDFNVRAIELPAPEPGVFRPHGKVHRRTALSTQYGALGLERYLLTYDNRSLRDIASLAPYDFLEILVNDAQYGGGGIYNFQATVSVDTAFASYVFVHEFGHHFAGLGDEYYTSDVSYETGQPDLPEPWAMNITAMKDPKRLKWGDLVEKETPLPTPWPKEEFEKRSREFQAERKKLLAEGAPPAKIDEMFRRQQVEETKRLGTGPHAGKVGAFEGASYEAKGLYRPMADCIMFTRDEVGFCRVCQRAITRVIDEYSRP